MPNLLKKFTKAANELSSKKKDIRKSVYGAYLDNLSDIDTDDLPEEIRIFYESVKMRLTSTMPAGEISDYEANRITEDILYMADVIRIYNRP